MKKGGEKLGLVILYPRTGSSVTERFGIAFLRTLTAWAKQWLVDFNPNKTEAILFSINNVNNPNLYFDQVPVTFVDEHKHLGLTFGRDGKWHAHVNNILTSASKMLGVMRSLKFKLNRKMLN